MPKCLYRNQRTTIRKAMEPNNRPLSPSIRPFNKRGAMLLVCTRCPNILKLSPSSA